MKIIAVLLVLGLLVTLVGHGLWVLLAWFFRALAGGKRSLPETVHRTANRPEHCAGCGWLLLPWQECCEKCGLERKGQAAAELHDLEVTARQLVKLRQAGTLDPQTLEHVQSCIDARRKALLTSGQAPSPQPASTSVAQPRKLPTPASEQPVLPLGERLQQLLESCPDVSSLALKERQHALLWYGQLAEDRLASLSATAQLALARLLRQVRKTDDSLRAYRRLLDRYPHDPEWAGWAFEAGRFAAEKKITDQACRFLEQALSRPLSPEGRQEVERLLQSLRLPAKEAIPEVIPVLEHGAPSAAPATGSVLRPAGAALGAPRAGAPPATAPRPRRSLTEVLAAFMEERNIFWGELVGGLLMVGCSIALVIYLWKDLERIPYFQFLIFVGTTASVFGAGLYAGHRLKLETTSRGLLVIATLLVPLNFLIMAGLAGQKADAEPYDTALRIGLEIVSLAIFAGLLNWAARVLVSEGRWLLIVTVLGVSASQLAVPRLLGLRLADHEPTLLPFVLLGGLPVAIYGVGTGGFLYRVSGRRPIEQRQATALFTFLGMAAFPLIVALGFLVYWSGDVGLALERLAVLIAVSGTPLLAGGMLVHRHLEGTPTPDAGPAGAIRTAGTAVALAGLLVMLAAVILAWPQPAAMILVCALNFTVLTAVAFYYREPVAHAVALPCLAIGYLTAFHLLSGPLPSEELGPVLLSRLLSAQSGSALVVLVLLLGVAAEWLVRAGQRDQGLFYAGGAGVAAGVSLLLVNVRGGNDPATATVVNGVYAAASLALNLRWRRSLVSYLGLALAVLTTLWALWWRNAALTPPWGTVLAFEAFAMAAVAALLGGRVRAWESESAGSDAPSHSPTLSPSHPFTLPLAHALIPAAWRDTAAVTGSLGLALALASFDAGTSTLHTWTGGALAATAFLLAWAYQAVPLTWAGSALLLGSLLHGSFTRLQSAHPSLAALLSHATLVLVGSLLIKSLRWTGASRSGASTEASSTVNASVQRLFAEPLYQSAFVSSVCTLPLLFALAWGEVRTLTVYLGWLSAVWLVIAWTARWPLLFAAFQAALTGTVLLGATVWLEGQAWVIGHYPAGLADPRSLQVYGIALGGLGLLWLLARLGLRSSARAQELFEPAWPAVDWVVLGVLVLGQFGLAVWGVLPGVVGELTPTGMVPDVAAWPAEHVHAYASGAWILLGVLAVVLTAALWERQQAAAVLGVIILAVTAPVLIAGRFEPQLASASALRWGLGICFLACSVPVWLRDPLTRLAGQLRCPGDPTGKISVLARGLLIAGSVVPVLALTLAVAVVGFSGRQPTGPLSGSFFADIGWTAANVMPLAMLSLGLVGHALRERSPGYAFSAGLVVNLAVTGGYALGVVTGGRPLGEVEWVRCLQLGTLTAAVWAIAWLASRPWVAAWREGPPAPRRAGSLMTVQLGMAAAGNAWLLLGALGLLVSLFPAEARWTAEVGSPLGWLALVLAAAAGAWRLEQQRSRLQPHTIGLIGMAALGLLACSIARQWPAWGYRALMLGWAGYAPALVLAAWARAWQSESVRAWESESVGEWESGSVDNVPSFHSLTLPLSHALTPDAVALWVRVAGVLAILLGLKAAIVHEEDHLWAAAAIALASPAGAAMAVWRRREDWAFTAGLGVNLAASLVVWHFHRQHALADWWVYLLQANVIAAASVALLWLGARKQLYGSAELRLATGPLLATQVGLGLAGNAVLLVGPLFGLVARPGESLPSELIPMGYVGGWLALGLAMAAAFWYAGQVAPQQRGHILGAFGVALGVLAACSASLWSEQGSWAAYHVLIATWTGTGLAILAAERIAQLKDGELAEFSPFPFLAQLLAFAPWYFRAWLNGIGLLVLGLALRGTWEDPARPYWSAGAALAVSAMAGAIALRSGLPVYAHVSGLLINLAGSMVWVAWGPSTPLSFGYTQVLCFALASGVWSLLELTLPRRSLSGDSPGRFFSFRHAAALYAIGLLGVLVAWSVASDVLAGGWGERGPLPWAALGATAVALAISLWDREARFSLSGLYAAGLTAIGLALHTLDLEPNDLGLTAALALAFYVLLTAAFARIAPRLPGLWQELRLPDRAFGWPEAWFAPAQTAGAILGVVLTVWLSLGPAPLEERLAGPLAVAILLPAGVLLAGGTPGRWKVDLRYATLALGVLLVAECGWAALDPSVPGLWLHRNVLLMAALALLTLVYGVGLVRLLPSSGDWTGCARRLGPVLGALASAMLVLVLVHEGLLYNADTGRTPMMPWAIVIVAAALGGLIAAGISFAIMPGREPLGLSERGRTLYVYAGEVLLVLLFVHFRLTVPELFRLGIVARYWTFIVMAIAFLGVGLSEFFDRKGLRVLAEPLQRTGVFLPLLPLLAFWVLPPARAQTDYGRYATLWFLAGSLYTLVAVARRSFRFALFAALAANFGLWALLVHSHLDFLTHPQMWLIPFALIILVAEHLNRDRLTEQQGNALRYLALLVIYISSTADMFIAGLGHSVVLPLFLAVLSVLGVLSGILLRVRAFLYTGVTFLFLVVFTMIWHAAVGRHQIWVWWASGIVLGAAIIALFAVFEKRRNDVLRLIEEIKKWN